MSSFKISWPSLLIGVGIGVISFLVIDTLFIDGGGDITPIVEDHCITKKDTVAKFLDDPAILIRNYKEWTLVQDVYKTQALNIPKDVVNSMFQLLKNNPLDLAAAPRAGVRIYYGSTSAISSTAMPGSADTRMILWPLDNVGNMDPAFPTSAIPILNTPAKFELPCPQYCD
jgi:hypothetical protein